MTTAGSNGAPEGPADDDPFAYLYRPAEGEEAASQPRNSYARPMEVGRAQYGQQPPRGQQPGYGQQQAPYAQQQPPYAQHAQQGQNQSQGQAAVPAQPNRYAEHSRPQPGEDRPSGGRGRAAVIGAVAVVAAIAIGAGIALSGPDKTAGDSKADKAPHSSASAKTPSSSGPPSTTASTPPASSDPVADASKLQAQGAPSATAIKGAISADGSYLTLQPGATITWTVSVPTADKYKFWLHYDNPGSDVTAAVSVNGKDRDRGVTFTNYSKSTDPTQAWVSTNIWPDLQAGSNTITVSIPAGGSGSIPIDQVAITPMSVSKYPH